MIKVVPASFSVLSFQAFGQSFLQPDIHIFKQNLSYLESLNSKHKLYSRVGSLFLSMHLMVKDQHVTDLGFLLNLSFKLFNLFLIIRLDDTKNT